MVEKGIVMTPEQIDLDQGEKFLAENNIKYLLAQFVDIHGAAKTKMVPAQNLINLYNSLYYNNNYCQFLLIIKPRWP